MLIPQIYGLDLNYVGTLLMLYHGIVASNIFMSIIFYLFTTCWQAAA